MVRLVGGMEVNNAGVVAGRFQDSHLVHCLSPAVLSPPTLPQKLGSKHLACGLLHTTLHYPKLAPRREKENSLNNLPQVEGTLGESELLAPGHGSITVQACRHRSKATEL